MSKWIAAFCVVVLVGAGIAVVQMPASAGDSWLTILWAAWIVAVIWALARPSFSLLFAVIMAAMFLLVIMPATEAQLFAVTTIAGNNYNSGIVRALQITALAQCAMLVGALAARTFWRMPSPTRLFPQLSLAPLDKAMRRSAGVGVLGVLGFSALGGASLSNFFVYTTSSGYGAFARATTGNLGYMVALQGVAGLALVLLPLRLGAGRSSHWLVPLFYAAVVTLVLLGGGQRGRFFVPAFAALLIWLKTSKRIRRPRRVAAVGMLVALVLGGFVGVARGASDSRNVTLGTVLAAPFGNGNDLFLPLAGLASAMPSQVPYLGGTSYLEAGAFLVPRALWSGKPEGSIANITATIDPSNSGLAFPEFGEMYANFGLPGVIVGSFLLGVLSRTAFQALRPLDEHQGVCVHCRLRSRSPGYLHPWCGCPDARLIRGSHRRDCPGLSATIASVGDSACARPCRLPWASEETSLGEDAVRSKGRHVVRSKGRHAARAPVRQRSELFANTIAAWIWSQGTLVASILALPLLTRMLSRDEFGLWTQLLSLSALATVADMGMSLAFLRRITDHADADRASILGSATAFYRLSSAILTAMLLLACLIPGGLLSPYMSHTRMPVLAALVVIAAIGINLRCQPCTLRLLARGRMDLERIFGAGPAVVGTLVSILAAYWFGTAEAVAIGYAAVEFVFDVVLVIVAYRYWPRSRVEPAANRTLAWWGRMWYESTGVWWSISCRWSAWPSASLSWARWWDPQRPPCTDWRGR